MGRKLPNIQKVTFKWPNLPALLLTFSALVIFLIGSLAFSIDTENSVAEVIANRSVSNTDHCESGIPQYGLYLQLDNINNYFTVSSGDFIEYDDGTAVLTMEVYNAGNSNLKFSVIGNYSGRTFNTPSGSPKSNDCFNPNTSNWYYYTNFSGQLIGRDGYIGAIINLDQDGPSFQLGVGANVTDDNNRFGGCGWLDVEIAQQANNTHIIMEGGGDFNIVLSGGPLGECHNVTDGGELGDPTPVCSQNNDPSPIVSLSPASGGSGAIEYQWLQSTSGCPDNLSQSIQNSNIESYNPGPINQTTWFRRCARRAGCSSWDFGESNCVKVDFVDNCPEPAPTDWYLTCEDGQSVEILGQGINCEDDVTFNIPNPGNVVQVIAEVVYKGTSGNPNSLTIETNNESANVQREFTSPAKAYYFRTTFGPATQVVVPHLPNNCQAQTILLYVFREGGQTTASVGKFVQKWMYQETHCEILEIPTAPAIRDVEITVPLSEITNDGRIAIVRANVVDNPSINAEVIIDSYNQGNSLHIAKLVLNGVSPLDTEIQICVESPDGSNGPNGQSLVYAGAIKANPDCKTCDDSDLTADAEVISNYNGTQISCYGADDGRLQALVGGGVPPFVYTWSNGQTGQIISNVAPGDYDVTIADQFGCTAVQANVSIDEPAPVQAIINFTKDYNGENISCFGAQDAAIEVIASGGNAPYMYQWDAAGNFQTSQALNNLSAGIYSVQVSDANGCITNASIEISQPQQLEGEVIITADYNGQNISCAGANDGALSVNPTEGTAPYSYQWSSGQSTKNIFDLGPGAYLVTITDANDCQIVRSNSIAEPNPILLEVGTTSAYNGFNISCFGGSDGSANAVASGGTGELSYAWSNGETTAAISNIAAGTFTVTVTDINECSISKSVTLQEPTELDIQTDVISNYNGTDISCAGANDARVEVMITGALAPYTINWSNGESTQIISDLGPGDYSVTVSDLNGCEKIATIEVNEPDQLTCEASISSNYFEGVAISTVGGMDGEAMVSVNGGNGAYVYQWDDANFQTGQTATNLVAGTYSVLVSDENGCVCTSSITLEDPAIVGDKIFIDENGNGIQDAGEAGLAGATLTLTGTSLTGVDVTRIFTTDASGMYMFDGLLPGNYKITLGSPGNYKLTYFNQGGNDDIDSDFDPSNNMTQDFDLVAGENKDNVDAGLYAPVKIGDYVWEDTNGNGIQDAGENGLNGVTVTIERVAGNGSPFTLTTTTDANGAYHFNDLIPGTYKLTFSTQPGFIGTFAAQGGDDTKDSDIDPNTGMTALITLGSGEENTSIDAGFFKYSGIGNFVWEDSNGNGIQDAGEPGIPNVQVTLEGTAGNGTPVSINLTTGANGDFLFDNLLPGSYKLTFSKPAGYEFGYQGLGGNEEVDSNADAVSGMTAVEILTSGETNLTFDAALYKAAEIGNYVWEDTNGNGIQDSGEQGIEGIQVTLVGTDGAGFDFSQILYSGINGEFLFTGLKPGSYKLTFSPGTEFLISAQDQGGDDLIDSDADPVTGMTAFEILTSGESNLTYDAGFYGPSTVGDYAWIDCNKNGVQDSDEAPLAYASVSLTGTDAIGVTVDLNTTTDVNGKYEFPNLKPGIYKLTFGFPANPTGLGFATANQGGNDNLDSDVVANGMTAEFTIVSSLDRLDLDAGYSDVTNPILTGIPSNITVECNAIPAVPVLYSEINATDNLDSDVEIIFTEISTQGQGNACSNYKYTITRTWLAKDDCGNEREAIQLIEVEDTKAPEFSGLPANVTVSCDAVPNPASPSASDNCDTDVTITFGEVKIDGGCENSYELRRTWTATDDCANQTVETQIITVEDATDPVLSGVPADVTVECDGLPVIPTVTASDDCDLTVDISFAEVKIDGICENTYELRRTWTATDACGNQNIETQTITVQDTQEPTLSGVPADLTIECDQVPVPAVPTAFDNCDDIVDITFAEVRIDGGCNSEYELRRTWTATDNCGNEISETQIINVEDNSDPIISGVPSDLTIECNDVPTAATPTVTDNCDANIEIQFLETTIEGACEDSYTLKRTWTAVDECGNESVEIQVITVQDLMEPTLSSVPANVTVECDEIPAVGIPTANDNCDDFVDIAFTEVIINSDCEHAYEIRRTWTATDNCGNQIAETQIITVEDNSIPTISGVPADLTVECDEIPAAANPIASDDCDANVELLFLETTVAGACQNNYSIVRTWTATDACGNQTIETQEITVEDNQAPVLNGVPTNVAADCDNIPTQAVPTASDNCDTNIDIALVEVITEGGCENEYTITRTWTATDACGNQDVQQQVISVSDYEAPVLSNIPSDLTVSCDDVPAATTVTASDNCDANIEVNMVEVKTIGDCEDSYTLVRTWTAIDGCGNQTAEFQTITVEDNNAPEFAGIPADLTVSCDDIPPAAEPTASDACDGDVDIAFSESIIEGDCANSYSISRRWTATDNCGNQTIETQKITVEDLEEPNLFGVPGDVTVACDNIPAAANPTASDNCDANVNIELVETIINGDCENSYQIKRTWTATDACGNQEVIAQTISVEDTEAPELIGVPSDLTVDCDAVPAAAQVTGNDNCAGVVDVNYLEVIEEGNCVNNYTIKRTWTVNDGCGNEVSETQIIIVEDTTAPELLGVPADLTVACGDIPTAAQPTATDNCDNEVTIELIETAQNIDCENSYTIVRTWTATDACGNQSVETQSINVTDIVDPTLSGVPADITVACDEYANLAVPTVTGLDDCDNEVEVSFAEMITEGNCQHSYSVERTWTAVDNCGNEVSETQTIEVIDNVDPTLNGVPSDVTVECSQVPAIPTINVDITSSDNCDASVMIAFNEIKTEGDCSNNYTLLRSWTATDACGNQTYEEQLITVVDTEAPMLSGVPTDITVNCDGVPNDIPVVEAEDNCDNQVEVLFSEENIPGACDNTYTLIRTWTAIDACGNEASASQTIEVGDDSSPVLSGAPSDVTVECDAIPAPATITAEDDCLDNLEINFLETIEAGDCKNSYTITRTWTSVDACGNEASVGQEISVTDNTAPELFGVPANVNIGCGDDDQLEVPTVTAQDNCDADITVYFDETTQPGSCENSYTLTRTWTATDDCGNSTVKTQTLIVGDLLAPSLSGVPSDVTVECTNIPTAANVIATDDCDMDVTLHLLEISTLGECDGEYTLTRNWTAIDDCGNETVEKQIITVIDITAPELSDLPLDLTIDVLNGEVIPDAGTVTAIDNCDAELDYNFTETQEPSADCGYVIVRTWIVTDDCDNFSTHIQYITVLDELTATLSPSEVTICSGESTELVASPNGAGYTYAWDVTGGTILGSGSTVSFTADATGEYVVQVTVTSASGCVGVVKSQVTVDNGLTGIASSNGPICGGENLELTASGGQAYIWSGPNGFSSTQANPVISQALPNASGTYQVEISNGSCSVTETVEVIIGAPITADYSLQDADCSDNGVISVGANGGSGVYSYDWADLPGSDDPQHRDDLAEGSYTVVITDTNGCSVTLANILINSVCPCDADAGTLSASADQVCLENATATLIGTANGDENIPNGFTQIYVLTQGTELVIVQTSNTPEFDVDELGTYTIHTLIYDPSTLDLGIVVPNVTTGFDVNDLLLQGSGDICASLDVAGALFNVTQSAAAIAQITPEFCDDENGGAILTPANYTYVWSDGGVGAERSDLANGIYSVLATSPDGCESTLEVNITENCGCVAPEVADIIVFEANCGLETGSAQIIVDGNLSDYNYTWIPNLGLPNSIGNERSQLAVGIYTVIISNNLVPDCKTEISISVGTSDGPTVTDIQTSASSCNGSNGAATILPAIYDYIWEFDGFPGNSRNDLSAGTYQVIVLDQSTPPCADVVTVTIESTEDLSIEAEINSNPNCESEDGSVTINVNGGSGIYNFIWSDDTSINAATRDNLGGGVYEVQVTDENTGCSSFVNFTLLDNVVGANVIITGIDNETCVGAENGFVDFTVSPFQGFEGPAQINIYDASGTIYSNGDLPSGAFCIVVRDNKDCFAGEACFEIEAAQELNVQISTTYSECDSTGTISVMVSGGAPGYTFDWADLPGSNDPGSRTAVAAGEYSVVISDAQGCSVQVDEVLVESTCSQSCEEPVVTNVVVVEASCGDSNGSITIEMLGENGNYAYDFVPQVGQVSENVMSNVPAGVYAVTVSDPNFLGCEIVFNVLVENQDGPVAQLVNSGPAQCGQSNGTAVLTPINYIYEWCNGTVDFNPNDLPAGICTVTITDPATGCTNFMEVEIPELNTLSATVVVTQAPDCGIANGIVSINIIGGSGNYFFPWGPGVSPQTLNSLSGGSYELNIQDTGTGCSTMLEFILSEDAPGEANIIVGGNGSTITLDCAGGQNGFFDFTINTDGDFQGPAALTIEDASGAEYENGTLSAGDYCLIVRDANGCLANSACFEILNPSQIDLDVALLNTGCTEGGSIELMPSGGAAGYSFDWADLPGSIDPANRTDLEIGSYSVTVMDVNGCIAFANNLIITDDCTPCPSSTSVEIVLPTNSMEITCFEFEDCFDTTSVNYAILGGGMNGSSTSGNWSLSSEGCLEYLSLSEIGTDLDEVCIIANNGTESDTTCYVFSVFDIPLFQPVTDTVFKSTLVDTEVIGCFDVDEIGGIVSSSTILLNTQNFGTITLDGKCYTYVPNPGVSGMFTDTMTVILCNDLIPICDTSTVILSIMPNGIVCDSIFQQENTTVETADCDNGIDFCIEGINPTELSTFLLLDNDVPVMGPYDTCNVEGSSINLSTGFHQLIIVDQITNCRDTLEVQVDCDDCPDFYFGADTLLAEDCDLGAAVCLDFDIADLFDYNITDNGVEYEGTFDACVIDTQYQYVAFQLGAPSAFTLNSWEVDGTEYTLDLFTTTQQLADSMNVWDPAGDWEVFGFVIVGGDGTSGYGPLEISTINSNFSVPAQIIQNATSIFLSEGAHTVVVERIADGCSQTINVLVECSVIPVTGDTLISIFEGTVDTFCFELDAVSSLTNLCPDENDGNTFVSVIDNSNCVAISGNLLGADIYCFVACDDNTGICDTVNIEVNVLPVTDTITESLNLGFTDTICIDTTIFQNPILSVVNICDNSSNMNVDFLVQDETVCLEYTTDMIGQDTACIVVCDTEGFCDTTIFIIDVIVPTIDTVELIILQENIDTFCLNDSELEGPVDTIYNICDVLSDENVNFSIDEVTNCIIYEGLTPGVDVACFVFCDNNNICDTTIMVVETIIEDLPIAVDDATTTTIGNGITIEVLLNDTINGILTGINIVTPPGNGNVIINGDGSITYVPNAEFCGDTDSFMYSISNEVGADTATVFIEVICEDLIIYSGFSPNGDEINDVFNVIGIENFPNNEVCIFNRWGNQVHREKGYRNDQGWRGTWNGKDLPDGTYYYVIDDGKGRTLSGFLQIHR